MSDRGEPIPIARPWLGDEEAEAAQRPLRSGWVTQGPEVEAFERAFAERVGAAHACAVSSGTAALHLALLAAGVGPGHEVITVSHSFIATANAIRYCGATPVFVDIEAGGFNMDPKAAAQAFSPRTRAVLCVHQLGMPCDLRALKRLADQAGVPLIEDAACALGSEVTCDGITAAIGKPAAGLAAFSFHPRKVITTGDGGMLTCDDAAVDARVRGLRNHAMGPEGFSELGYNYRLTDIQAAIGRVQLGRLDRIVALRRQAAERYRELLGGLDGLGLPVEPDWARSNWQSYCVALPPGAVQGQVMQALADKGIASRPGISNAHSQPAYPEGSFRVAAEGGLVRSEWAQDHCLMLPLFPQLRADEQQRVAHALTAALA